MHAKNDQKSTKKNQELKRYGLASPQIQSTSRNVRSAFNTTPYHTSFELQMNNPDYKKCPHANKNANRNNFRPGSATWKENSNFRRQDINQASYKKCGHLNNSTHFSTGINSNNVLLQRIPVTGLYKKCIHANTKPVNVQDISNMSLEKINIPEETEAKDITNNANENKAQTQNANNVEVPVQKSNPVDQQIIKNTFMKNGVKPNSPSTQKQSKNITEIYKRTEPLTQDGEIRANSKVATNSEPPNTENLNFQKVTQELANIIKNFQTQICDIPISRGSMEQVPSAMIQPKIKKFFKGVKTCSKSSLPVSTQTGNKNTKPRNKGVHKQRSLRNFSRGSLSPKLTISVVRRFSSFTNNVPYSLSNPRIKWKGSFLSVDPLKQLKNEVQKAIRDRKTFTIRGHFPAVRKALLARGWVEKFHTSYMDHLHEEMKRYKNYSINELLPLMRREDLTVLCKNLIKSKLLGGYQVDFYWGTSCDAFRENPDKIKYTLINKLKREIFSYTNKQGLCDASKFSYWYQKSNVSKLNHPRSYSLGKNGDLKGFTNDFYMTAAMSLLKWVVKMNTTKECKLLSPSGKIPLEAFDFALNECCKFIKKARHEDIDMQIPEATENEWNQFVEYFYKLVHYNNHFKAEKTETGDSLVRKSNYVLNNLRSFYPFVDMDGMMNIWLVKPSASSRGRGIHMCRTLQYIFKVIKQNSNTRYVIQKYIERPLLIYNTKFDIRQWFLISNCCPLTIWIYKDCYLRFSSQTYNLRKLHESIHITNNSVQSKYQKNGSFDTALPNYNMWDSTEFKNYLTNIGYPNAFKDVTYPGMKQSITAAVLMHQNTMVVRKNCFELYGADFIVTEDFQPWLLEINSNPALYASTPVTARMCPRVLEDVIKVVIDYARNSKADTGGFEMIYKEQMTKLPSASTTLALKGQPLKNSYFFNAPDQELTDSLTVPSCNKSLAVAQTQDCLKVFGEEIKKTLKNLLQIIHNEKQKRETKYQSNENSKIVSTVKR